MYPKRNERLGSIGTEAGDLGGTAIEQNAMRCGSVNRFARFVAALLVALVLLPLATSAAGETDAVVAETSGAP